jgi:hypothetical protein
MKQIEIVGIMHRVDILSPCVRACQLQEFAGLRPHHQLKDHPLREVDRWLIAAVSVNLHSNLGRPRRDSESETIVRRLSLAVPLRHRCTARPTRTDADDSIVDE